MKHYHNTTNLNEITVISETIKCQSQEQIILEIYKRSLRLSASQVLDMYPNQRTPLTSVRRAISNLMYDGKLIKTDDMKEGIYGKPEHIYELAEKQLQLF